jgi:hypothetical protein
MFQSAPAIAGGRSGNTACYTPGLFQSACRHCCGRSRCVDHWLTPCFSIRARHLWRAILFAISRLLSVANDFSGQFRELDSRRPSLRHFKAENLTKKMPKTNQHNRLRRARTCRRTCSHLGFALVHDTMTKRIQPLAFRTRSKAPVGPSKSTALKAAVLHHLKVRVCRACGTGAGSP